ncbi:MAG: 30S ribosomal protein S20 [Candidatus Shapirobacteria bacterium]|jgi:ribosomal protein S20
MPISLSAKKSLRVAKRNHKTNVVLKQKFKSTAKKFQEKPTSEGLIKVVSLLDKLDKGHLFHHNKVNRMKSRFSKMVSVKAEIKIENPAKKKVKKAVKKVVKKS